MISKVYCFIQLHAIFIQIVLVEFCLSSFAQSCFVYLVLCDRVDPEFKEEYLDPAASAEGSPLLNEGKSQTFDHIEPSFSRVYCFTLSCMATFIRNGLGSSYISLDIMPSWMIVLNMLTWFPWTT